MPMWIQRAKDGDYLTARMLLGFILDRWTTGCGISDPELDQWFADGVAAFLRGECKTLDNALGVGAPRGRTRWDFYKRDRHVRGLVELYRERHPDKPLDDKGDSDSVFEAVGRWYGEVTKSEPLSEGTVRRIWYSKED